MGVRPVLVRSGSDGEVTRRLISSGSPFEKLVGYSGAVVDGDSCFVAGTTGYDPVTKVMPESAAEQAKNALGVIEKALGEAGFALARSDEHTSELQSLMRISYAVFCLKKRS